MPFRSALSGIQTSGKDLKVIANNVANASTTGFKKSRAMFADVYASSDVATAANAIGAGVRLAAVKQQFGQGNVEFTDSPLDMAINGGGFFIVDKEGAREYTRAGSFQVDRQGNIVNTSGQGLIANKADENGNTSGDIGPLSLDNANIEPSATKKISVGVNLDSNSKPPVTEVFDPQTPTSFTHSTSLTIYDSLGSPHLGTMYFVKTPTENQWNVHLFVDGKDINGATEPPFASTVINFDGSGALAIVNGEAIPPGNGLAEFPAFKTGTGSVDLNVKLDFIGRTPTTQFGSKFNVSALTQDGYTTGRLTNLDINQEGIMSARYTNGQTRVLGQVALAAFPNPEGLRQLGESSWAESFESGIPLVGSPGSGSLGVIQSGALEGSNVDLTEQLVNMINAQRNFQANAQVITTADTVTQTVINIRR